MDKIYRLRLVHGELQLVLKFDNGYGVSIVPHDVSYGQEDDLFELGVVTFDDDGKFSLTYNTPITSDVLGYLTLDDVKQRAAEVMALPKE